MVRIPRVPLSVALGVLLLVSGAGMYGYGWYEESTKDCSNGVSFERVEQPSSATVTNFSSLTHDQQGVFLLGFDEDGVGGIYTSDDEIMDIAHSLPWPINYNGTIYKAEGGPTLCSPGVLPASAGLATMFLSVVVFAIGGTVAVVRRVRS